MGKLTKALGQVEKALERKNSGQAKAGGEYGLNGEWYSGGQFMPSSARTVKGKYRIEKDSGGSGDSVLVAPGQLVKKGDAPEGQDTIFTKVKNFAGADWSSGELNPNVLVSNNMDEDTLLRNDMSKERLDYLIDRFNSGERFYHKEDLDRIEMPEIDSFNDEYGQASLKPLAGVAAGSATLAAAPLAYNAVKDPLSDSYNQTMDNIANRERPNHSELAQRSYDRQMAIKDKFFSKRALRQAAKNVVGTGEAALTLGSGLANESAAGLAAMYGGATGQDPNAILNHFNENASLYLPQTDEGMAQLEGLQKLIQETTDYWSPRGGAQAVQNFKQSQDWLNTQGSKISPEVGAGLATGLGLLPELL